MATEGQNLTLGYDGDLYLLAFDHRGAFARAVLDVDGHLTAEQEAVLVDAKRVIFEGLERSLASGRVSPSSAGILVDELYGALVAKAAVDAGLVLAMPVEAPDKDVFELAYGEHFDEHLDAFCPRFAKVLVRYNVAGDSRGNELQAERLARLSSWLRDRELKLVFELIVEPTPQQLARCSGDRLEFEIKQRPDLMCAGIAELQASGVEPDVWKVEGLDEPADAHAVVSQARSGRGRERVACTVLGAGADHGRVHRWLRVAASVPGFRGFAIGRSIWREPIREMLAGSATRAQAAEQIAGTYVDFVDVYRGALARTAE